MCDEELIDVCIPVEGVLGHGENGEGENEDTQDHGGRSPLEAVGVEGERHQEEAEGCENSTGRKIDLPCVSTG